MLLFAPFLLWKVLGLEQMIGRYEAFFYIGLYVLMAQEFIRHPSRIIFRGDPWNEKVIIQRTIYEQADNCDDHGRIHSND